MILATVTTCPARWENYQRLRRNFEALDFGFNLRTFQTTECAEIPFANNNLNARAALAYADRHLPGEEKSWLLYLEDDVLLNAALAALLPTLVEKGKQDEVDCWYLCNRKNQVTEQYRVGQMAINRLAYPVDGSHGLLLPKRHLRLILDAHWDQTADRSMFAAIRAVSWNVFQVIEPVLVEHLGEYSTYNPSIRRELEVNHAS
jgi:hypothetical protein